MFWRERERESREQNGGPLCGQVRVLVVGDSGVGKTSLVHLVMNGHSISRPPPTIGCSVSVKHMKYGSSGSSSSITKGDAERDFFVELWDISGHDRYKDCRSLFYSQINGVIFVYDLSQRKTKSNLIKWASEIAATGTFSAPMGSAGPGGLSVPYIVIKKKADTAAKEGSRVSSGNLVDMARHWVEKQGLLPPSEELPLVESFPGSGTLLALEIWRNNGLDFNLVHKDRVRLYDLLAGNVHDALRGKEIDLKRFLGLLMWYALPPDTPLPSVFHTYQHLLAEGKAPTYIEEGPPGEAISSSMWRHYDLSFYFMILHANESSEFVSLKSMLSTFASTNDPLDYHMILHQRAMLEGIGAFTSKDLHILDMTQWHCPRHRS